MNELQSHIDRCIEAMKDGKVSGFRHYVYRDGKFIGNFYQGPRVVKESAVRESILAYLQATAPRRRIRA
jgi:hypothetical protein